MDNLYCKGNEHELHHCPFDGWKIHDCEPNEVAGVVCKESIISSTARIPDPVRPMHPVLEAATSNTNVSSPLRTSRFRQERRDDSNANQVINLQENMLQPDLQQQPAHAEPILMSPLSMPSTEQRPSLGSPFPRQPLLLRHPLLAATAITSTTNTPFSSSNQIPDTVLPTHSSSHPRRQQKQRRAHLQQQQVRYRICLFR